MYKSSHFQFTLKLPLSKTERTCAVWAVEHVPGCFPVPAPRALRSLHSYKQGCGLNLSYHEPIKPALCFVDLRIPLYQRCQHAKVLPSFLMTVYIYVTCLRLTVCCNFSVLYQKKNCFTSILVCKIMLKGVIFCNVKSNILLKVSLAGNTRIKVKTVSYRPTKPQLDVSDWYKTSL